MAVAHMRYLILEISNNKIYTDPDCTSQKSVSFTRTSRLVLFGEEFKC